MHHASMHHTYMYTSGFMRWSYIYVHHGFLHRRYVHHVSLFVRPSVTKFQPHARVRYKLYAPLKFNRVFKGFNPQSTLGGFPRRGRGWGNSSFPPDDHIPTPQYLCVSLMRCIHVKDNDLVALYHTFITNVTLKSFMCEQDMYFKYPAFWKTLLFNSAFKNRYRI